MQTPENHFKARLAQPGAAIGLWLALADSYAAELCATAGFDWLLVDNEHTPNDLRSTLSIVQTLAGYPVDVVARVPHGDTALIKQYLDIGVTTLLVPMVDSAHQARELVRATRYPPSGIRGVGSGIARSSRWGRHGNYLHEANQRVALLVQVESREGLAALRDIAAVDGVDGVFIGPADLSASLGHLGEPSHPEVRAAIDDAISTIQLSGKASGILANDEALARHYIELGVRFIAVGADTGLLARATRELARRFMGDPKP
jgi:4-hydroxy-2-oxoheptanedioate aldolase